MRVELLVVPDCPNGQPARQLLNTALADVGLPETAVRTTVISDEADARAHWFIGSPTFLLDGHDPFAEPGQPPGMACRLYRTAEGSAGLPSLRDLRQALERAADPIADGSG
jgi:hypothetical protein